MPYFHVMFTMPAKIADIAWPNKAEVYGILFKAVRRPSDRASIRSRLLTISST